ncbi:MAG: glycosyltransferase family 39 protein [Candidatus Levybacteria bacterium]|nr:glycosyltransferase family 39 protein [Candidatus Levybacteria bacterium]
MRLKTIFGQRPIVLWTTKLKNFSFLAILGVLLLAAFLRIYRIEDYMTFLGDEGRDVLVVYNILHGQLTLLGPTASVGGFFLGPIYYYFMAPFLFLFNLSPAGPAVMVALFSIATVYLTYKVGSEFFGKTAGLIAALLYSISPLVIAYSHSSWNPNLMPFFSLLSLYTLYKAVSKNKPILFLLTGFLLGITMQLHYLTTFLGVVVAAYVLILNWSRRIEMLKKLTYILVGFIIGWLPFLAFEARHEFLNIKSIFAFVFNPQGRDAIVESHGFFASIFDVFFRLFGRLVASFPPPEQIVLHPKFVIFAWQIGIWTLAIFSSLFLLNKTYKLFKSKNESLDKYLLLSVWLVLGILLFGLYRKQIYDYYFGFMFPLPFLLAGNVFQALIARKKMYQYIATFALLGLIAVNLNGVPFKFEPNRQLKQIETIANFVIEKSEGKPYNFGLVAAGNSDHAYRYFFKIWGKEPVTIQNPSEDPQRKSVTDQLLVVCETLPCHPLGWASWEIAGFGRAEIENLWDVSVVQVAKLSHYKGK